MQHSRKEGLSSISSSSLSWRNRDDEKDKSSSTSCPSWRMNYIFLQPPEERQEGRLNKGDAELNFRDHRTLGYFRTEEIVPMSRNNEDEEDTEPPRLLPLEQIKGFTDYDLCMNMDNSTMIQTNEDFYTLRQTFFYRWLLGSEYFKTVMIDSPSDKPHFICSDGRLVDMLLTHVQKRKGWHFYAAKWKGIIFLANLDAKEGSSNTLRPESYAGYVYKDLVTGTKHLINEYEKTLYAKEVSFGSHKLLMFGEVDAILKNQNEVKIRAYKPNRMEDLFRFLDELKIYEASDLPQQGIPHNVQEQEKFMKFWAISTVPGMKEMVLGQRNEGFRLKQTNIVKTEELWEWGNRGSEMKGKCYDFVNRMLNFIKNELNKDQRPDDEGIMIKKFEWRPIRDTNNAKRGGINVSSSSKLPPKNPKVFCSLVESKEEKERVETFMFPNWFIGDSIFLE